MVRGLVRRVGGKYYNHKHFIDLFPIAKTYCEVFVGGGSVVLNKKRQYDSVIINDNDTRLTECYRHVQQHGDTMNLDGTYSKEDFILLKNSTSPEDYLIQHHVSFITCNMYNPTYNTIKNSTKRYTTLKKQLQGIIIRNEDWSTILTEYDSPDTFFYLDPPYENSTKTVGKTSYVDINLVNLFDMLRTIKGKFLMTLNDSDTIRELSKEFIIIPYSAYYFRSKKTVTELIIKNF